MNRRFILILLAVAVFGLAMVPGQAWAQHPDLWLTFEVFWVFQEEYDMDVRITLADENDGPILGFTNIALTPNAGYDEWTHHFLNIPDAADRYKITWDDQEPGAIFHFDLPMPLIGDIDWENEEINDWTSCNPDE